MPYRHVRTGSGGSSLVDAAGGGQFMYCLPRSRGMFWCYCLIVITPRTHMNRSVACDDPRVTHRIFDLISVYPYLPSFFLPSVCPALQCRMPSAMEASHDTSCLSHSMSCPLERYPFNGQ